VSLAAGVFWVAPKKKGRCALTRAGGLYGSGPVRVRFTAVPDDSAELAGVLVQMGVNSSRTFSVLRLVEPSTA